MKAWEQLLLAPAAQALAWALAHFLWQGTVLAAVLAAGLALARHKDARLRYAMSAAALAAMPVAFAVTFLLCLPDRPAAALRWISLEAARSLAGASLAAGPSGQGAGWMLWAVSLWVAGVLLMWVRSAGGWWAAARLTSRQVRRAPVEWEERLAGLAGRMGVTAPVRLLESFAAGAPVVAGYLRPVLLAPVGMFSGLTPGQVECILAHELAHVLRRDYLAAALQSLVEGLLFYHPAVWWVSGRLRTERENCCDDVAVRYSGSARYYAATLAALEEMRWNAPEPVLAVRGGALSRRIRRLLGVETPSRPMPAAAMLALLLLLSGVVAAAAWRPAAPVTLLQDREAQMRQELGKPFQKWLDEDVVYIITPEERQAFLRLKDDAERVHFIEQFWLRRDPTPGTPANEFKEEHYRRIQRANERFAASVPGWRTDRGHVYIVFGPPDEIESHPGSASKAPSEAWRYHFIEGLGSNIDFEFLDANRTGNFRLIKSGGWKALERK